MRVLVFNGWAAGPETWNLCSFPHDWVFDYIEQLDGLPERVMAEFDEAVLVGFSMGGLAALRLCLRYPEKVKGLVLVSATPCMMEHPVEGWKGMSERRLAALRFGTRLVFRGNPSPLYAEANMDRGLDYLRHGDLREELRRFSSAGDATLRSRAVTGEFRFPVRVIQSERDGIVRPSNAAFLGEVFPQAEVTMVPGNEHVLPILVPELIDSAVFSIIRRV